MNKKGQLGVGTLLAVFAGVIVALALYGSVVGYYGTTSTTYYLANKTITAPAAQNGYIDVVGQEYISGAVVTNATSGAVVPASNYTISEVNSATDGLKRIRFTILNSTYAGNSVNVSYVYGPEGYIEDSAGRSITSLIAIFAALAIAISVLVPILREKLDF